MHRYNNNNNNNKGEFKKRQADIRQGKLWDIYRSVNKSLTRPGRKQATATEDLHVHMSYLLS